MLFPQQTKHYHACTLPTRLRPCHKIVLVITQHQRTLAWQGSVTASRYSDLHSTPYHSNVLTHLYPSLESWTLHGLISSSLSYSQHMPCVTLRLTSSQSVILGLVVTCELRHTLNLNSGHHSVKANSGLCKISSLSLCTHLQAVHSLHLYVTPKPLTVQALRTRTCLS
jgi:hypothetical protein